MSRVYFHSPSGEAELHGSERAWLGGLCDDIARGILDVQNNHERVREFLPDRPGYTPYPQHGDRDFFVRFQQWRMSAEMAVVGSFMSEGVTWKGQTLRSFSLVLNTACKVGGDAIKLAARIHGQCEIHCWCEGKDRAWLAGIIDQGLRGGVFRSTMRPEAAPGVKGAPVSQGWESVTAFLRSRDDEPVVMSYSVCDGFPNYYEANWRPPAGADLRPSWVEQDRWDEMAETERADYAQDARSELWSELGTEEQWRIAMDALRAKGGGLRLDPEDWDTFTFGHELSVFDLLASDYANRLDSALEIITADAEVEA